jgi:hypothetical protein
MVLVLLAIPIFYWVLTTSIAYVSGPTLYDGDRIETRSCRQCGGSGKDIELAMEIPGLGDRCPFCAGNGTVDVILPGPRRPSKVWGAVVDARVARSHYAYSNPHNIRMLPTTTAFAPVEQVRIEGAVAGATVQFTHSGGETTEVRSSPSGRFFTRLAPGSYQVSVSASGFESFACHFEVAPLTEPIWLEKATLHGEMSSDEARSAFGLSLLVAIPNAGGSGGYLRDESAF